LSGTMPGAAPSPQLFFDTVTAYQRTEALKAALQLDLFTAIAEGKKTPKEIAERCKSSERGTRILCDYLVIQGFLTKQGKGYGLTRDSAIFLDQHSSAYIGGTLRFLLSPSATDGFKELAAAVRKGGTAKEENGTTPEHPMWVDFARGMAPMMAMPAEQLAAVLKADEGQKWKVLGLAVGHGVYEITLARHNKNAEVWAVDWPNVLEVARENAAAAGVASRYHTIPGSAFDVKYGDGYDLVVVTNFFHHFDIPTCTKLLGKINKALQPGGRVAILEFVPNEDRVSPPVAAGFSLTMLAGTPAGDAYTFAEYQQMLAKAGFSSSEVQPLSPTFFSLVIGKK
jgi:ubiquinone/menaquinone biosynthesis C-methylase UbiE